MTRYCTMRRAVQSNAPAPDAGVVAGIEADLRAALLTTGLFHTVEVGRTDDPDRLVIALVSFAPEIDASEAAVALARLWSKHIAYGFWRAETLRVDKGHVELQGATRAGLTGHYATVHLVAQEAPVPARTVTLARPARPTPSTGIGHSQPSLPPVRRPRRRVSRPTVA